MNLATTPDSSATPAEVLPVSHPRARRLVAAAAAVGCGWSLLCLAPWLELAVFARGAAQLAGLLTGAPVVSAPEGWLLLHPAVPMAVTAKCSATDFFLLLVALFAWHGMRWSGRAPLAIPAALAAALPVAVLVNSLRLTSLIFAHHWLMPQFPPAYESILHMLTGAAVFLPCLIVLNLLLESHARRHHSARG